MVKRSWIYSLTDVPLVHWLEPRIARPPLNYLSLMRTSSLPSDAEVWRLGLPWVRLLMLRSRAYHTKHIRRISEEYQRSKVLGVLVLLGRCWEHIWTAFGTARSGEVLEVDVVVQLAFGFISSTRNYLDPSASWQAKLHPAHFCPTMPSWKCAMTHTHASTQY